NREFAIDLRIEHCTEGHLMANYIAKHAVRAAVGASMSTRSKVELRAKGWERLTVLLVAGVSCSITTDHPVVGIEDLMTSAIHAVKAGITEQQAMRAIPLNAAKHIGVDETIGSIEKGKDADFVIWSGNPFDLRNKVEQVYIDGKRIK